jgi:hypothetical protein
MELTMIIKEKLNLVKDKKNINLLVNILGFLLLIIIVLTKTSLTYDEPLHLQTVEALNHYGFSLQFLRGTDVSAPGPLYAVTHYLFQGITHLQAPGIRLVNVIFLLFIIIILRYTFREMKYEQPLLLSFGIMSIPIIWPISGMALTEIPAMLFACLSIFLLLLALKCNNDYNSLFYSLISGLFFGFSILGRQTFLIMLLALPLLTVRPHSNNHVVSTKKIWQCISIFLVASILMPCIQFYIWGGLVPHSQAAISTGFSITHGLLSLSYAGIVMFILTPKWFDLGWKLNISILSITFLLNIAFSLVDIKPALSLAQKVFLDDVSLTLYSRGTSSFMLSIGIIFCISTIKNMWGNRNDNIFLFLSFSVLLLALSSAKITHLFSSRYTATAVPFIILASAKYSQNKKNYWEILRTFIGNVLGFLTLSSYF